MGLETGRPGSLQEAPPLLLLKGTSSRLPSVWEGGGLPVEGRGGISPSNESRGVRFIISGSLLASGASQGQQECVR